MLEFGQTQKKWIYPLASSLPVAFQQGNRMNTVFFEEGCCILLKKLLVFWSY
jgi:hypothetical protein